MIEKLPLAASLPFYFKLFFKLLYVKHFFRFVIFQGNLTFDSILDSLANSSDFIDHAELFHLSTSFMQ